jgi:D-3-phosphoglycerate dehydrogenase
MTMSKPKILVADPISERGVEELAAGGHLEVVVKTGMKEPELLGMIAEFDGLVVRSQTKVNAKVIDAATRLRVVGRAGVGVDNVDVDAATRRGIIVMNTPGGNTISTAEHAFSLMMALARKIPQAHASIKAGKWDRKSFEGVELYGKTLAILGMGRIGTEFARRAMAFGMRVVAFDPYLSVSRARALQVELCENLDDTLPRADFITMHMPLTEETRHMLDARRLALCRKGVRIVNCARGGLIDEAALAEAIRSGHVAGAALDVFEVEPPPADYALREVDAMVFTPHLGASTAEAQESVGIEVAQQIRAAIVDGEIRNAVNVPNIDAKTLAAIGPFLSFGENLGRFVSQIAPKRCERLEVHFRGTVNDHDTKPITRAALKGFLELAGGKEVNLVNAPSLAENLGLKVGDSRENTPGDFTETIEVVAVADGSRFSVTGTFFGTSPRIVMVNGRHVEARPAGVLLMLENRDVPGIVGRVGSLLGKHGVNIASMSLSRTEPGGQALTILNLDSVPAEPVLAELLALENITSANVVRL